MPRETLMPLPADEMIGISADRCYCTFNPEDPPCAPCQARNPELREPELMDEPEAMDLEDRLDEALDQNMESQIALQLAEMDLKTVERFGAIELRPVTLKILTVTPKILETK